jgi:tetratricopeptide (TPR) repeat protein
VPADVLPNSVFVSCVSDEFEKREGPFPGLRSALRHFLARAHCHMVVQEDFPQTSEDTVEKLAGLVCRSAAVLHLVGELPGAVANARAVAAFLASTPKFLNGHPELRAALGDFTGISYTQWEAYLALHYDRPLFVYATEKGDAAQATHLKRLRLGRKYPGERRITTPADLLGQLIGDIHTIVAAVPKFTRVIAPSRIIRHAPPVLFGREKWLDALDDAWANPKLNVYTLVAWGGVGKTSLVAHWISQRFAAHEWPGVERYFDWSFYSQGTGESRQTSSDLFIHNALTFFGDPDPVKGSPWERGERLAGLIRRHRTLLVLDGIEPLQYPINDLQAGRLKDQALESLLQGLAADNPGLCIVTTREHLKNVENQATTAEEKLDKLVKDAAVALLRHLQIVGTEEEMAAAWQDAGGHALTLHLLGRFIADAYEDRDIRHYREVKFEAADLERQGRSAFKVMIAYERWLQSAGPERQRELALLRLTGLFDRPVSRSCLQALRAEPIIPGLTDALVGLKDTQWNVAVKRLSDIDLLTVTPDAIDAHPLIREYFAKQLRDTQPEAFRAAHSRLFDHLCETTKPHRPDTLAGLQPLYQAVVHGCHAGRHQEAFDEVYWSRIQRKKQYYPVKRLGAVNTELACVSCFFSVPWEKLYSSLVIDSSVEILDGTSEYLHIMGRLPEALQAANAMLSLATRAKRYADAAGGAVLTAEICISMGRIDEAISRATEAKQLSDAGSDAFARKMSKVALAIALHQKGNLDAAEVEFSAAEDIQRTTQNGEPYLVSIQGCDLCDLFLDRAVCSKQLADRTRFVALARKRAELCLKRARSDSPQGGNLLVIGLAYLQLERCTLLECDVAKRDWAQCAIRLCDILAQIRQSGGPRFQLRAYLPLAQAQLNSGNEDSAKSALNEAQQIAERGPMPLFLADVHLHRARLFHDKGELTKAAKLIRELGYGRRYDELADAEAALSTE